MIFYILLSIPLTLRIFCSHILYFVSFKCYFRGIFAHILSSSYHIICSKCVYLSLTYIFLNNNNKKKIRMKRHNILNWSQITCTLFFFVCVCKSTKNESTDLQDQIKFKREFKCKWNSKQNSTSIFFSFSISPFVCICRCLHV